MLYEIDTAYKNYIWLLWNILTVYRGRNTHRHAHMHASYTIIILDSIYFTSDALEQFGHKPSLAALGWLTHLSWEPCEK